MTIIERLVGEVSRDGTVVDVRVGALWTGVAVEVAGKVAAGLASTQFDHDIQHGTPLVRDAGRLIGKRGSELAHLVLAESVLERAIGFAALNALLEPDASARVDVNAEDVILARLQALPRPEQRVAIVGHFPFVPRLQEAAQTCWVLELNPQPGDLPAAEAPRVLPQAAIVAITGMSLVNCTFEGLAALCRPDAYVLVLGATTPLSPVLYDYGVDAISGTVLEDVPAAFAAISQGANFRQIPGKRLVTMQVT